MPHELVVYIAYTACTRVTLTALETVGQPYEERLILFEKGEHKAPDFLKINPQGKVPALIVDGVPLGENTAIITWLHKTWPEAGLLPPAKDAFEEAQQLSALCWVASTWHPSVRAVKVPMMWTTGDTGGVREQGGRLMSGLLDRLDRELGERRFWFGDDWSIVDSYLWWAYINSELGGFDLSPWQNVLRHRADVEAMPQVQRAIAREQAAWNARKGELA